MLTFDDLSKVYFKTERLPDNIGTHFWEELYQLFKKRLEEEQSHKQSAIKDSLTTDIATQK